MADKKDFTSLLGKSTGNFKDYAQAYFSQGNKKSNRGRNLFLASILFNGAESKMRAKIQSQLEDLED